MTESQRNDKESSWVLGKDYLLVPMTKDRSALFVSEGNALFIVSWETAKRLQNGFGNLKPEEFAEWKHLLDAGYCGRKCVQKFNTYTPFDGAYTAINLNATSRCNLACVYCFARGGAYGKLSGDMSLDTLDDIFSMLRHRVDDWGKVRFEYFGGEPLLNYRLIKEVCERSETYFKDFNVRIHHRISTNLTVLPADAIQLFERFAFTVSVSIDGGQATHQRNRPGRNGKDWFATIIGNCRKIRMKCPHVVLVARMTVYDNETSLYRNVRDLWAEDIFDYFQVLPAISINSRRECSLDNIVSEYRSFVKEYSTLFSRENRFNGLLEFELMAEMVLSGKAATSYCSAGRHYFTISSDRTVSPCHRLIGVPDYAVGDLDSERFTGLTRWRQSVLDRPGCRRCWARFLCGGGCQQAFIAMGEACDSLNNDICNYERSIARGIIVNLADADVEYLSRDRTILDDLFVSCGRPVVSIRSNPGGRTGVFFCPITTV